MALNYFSSFAQEFIRELSQDAGQLGGQLRADANAGALFGTLRGYQVCVIPDPNKSPCELVFSVSRMGAAPNPGDFQPLATGCPVITACQVTGYRVSVTTKGSSWSAKKRRANARQALLETLHYLASNGFVNCCQCCGRQDAVYSYFVGGTVQNLCPNCGGTAAMQVAQAHQQAQQKPENIPAGAVGALLGSLVGALCIVLIGQLGYISVISGFVMGVCTVKGYELLGGKLSNTGIVISAVLMILMVYLGDRANWAIEVVKAFGVDFFTAFRLMPEAIRVSDLTGSYVGNLVLVYLFTALGAIPSIINRRKAQTNAASVYPLGTR